MERIDDTGFGGLRVIQTKGSGYGVDAVLLAAFAAGDTGAKAPVKAGGSTLHIADLGTGCGVAAFILFHKLRGARITGYDVNGDVIERAKALIDFIMAIFKTLFKIGGEEKTEEEE